jgi:Flp pilus assembly pilin Flp
MRRAWLRRDERGGVTLEHLGVLAVVVVLVAGVVVAVPDAGQAVGDGFRTFVCRVTGGDCDAGAAGDPGDGVDGGDGGDEGGDGGDDGGWGGLLGFVPPVGDIVDGALEGLQRRIIDGVAGFGNGLGEFFEGLASPVTGAIESIGDLIDDPGQWLEDRWNNFYNHIAFWNWDTFAESWKEFGKDFLAWDEWGRSWPRALGTVLVNVATLGVGALVKRFLFKGKGDSDAEQNAPDQNNPDQNNQPGPAPNPQFTDSGSGDNLRRTTQVDGVNIRVNSGHGYRPGHGSTDITSVLDRDTVDSAVANDLARRVNAGEPVVPAGSGHTTFQTQVGGHTVEYRVVRLADGSYNVGTYYIP